MKVVVAIDSFKGSLTSLQAANAVKEAVLKANENAYNNLTATAYQVFRLLEVNDEKN